MWRFSNRVIYKAVKGPDPLSRWVIGECLLNTLKYRNHIIRMLCFVVCMENGKPKTYNTHWIRYTTATGRNVYIIHQLQLISPKLVKIVWCVITRH